jgi:hypothetical protein
MGSFSPDGDFLPAEGAIASLLAEAAEAAEVHPPTAAEQEQQRAADGASPEAVPVSAKQPLQRIPTNDFSGISHSSIAFDVRASSSQDLPMSPTSAGAAAGAAAVRSHTTSPAIPVPSSAPPQQLALSGQPAHLRSSVSADFSSVSSGGVVQPPADRGEKASSSQRNSDVSSAAAVAAAAAAEARKKEHLRLKAIEKKAQDAKALRVMKNRMYQKLFSLPASEELIEDYSQRHKT